MEHYCTYFDSQYLARALPLYRSMDQHLRGEFRLLALCLDEAAEQALQALRLPHVMTLSLASLEAADPGLHGVKAQRSRVEYYFTATPCLMNHVLAANHDLSRLTYLDADLFFFGDPGVLFAQMGDCSIQVVPHRFPERLRGEEKNGLFNVGWVSVRRDSRGMAAVQWWRERCLEWCYDRYEEGRYADQKYLDAWPDLFPPVHITPHKGADLAPWNVEQYRVTRRGGRVFVDDEPLLFYHFQGYRQFTPRLTDPGIACHGRRIPSSVIRDVHLPYVKAVRQARADLQACGWGDATSGSTRHHSPGTGRDFSRAYQVRCVLEGKAVGWWGGRGWYWDSRLGRGLTRAWDRCRGRTGE